MAKRKLLARMNQRGVEAEITGYDPDTDKEATEKVWLQKLSGADQQAATAKADAARARTLLATRDRDGEGWLAMHQSAIDLGGEDALIDLLVTAKVGERFAALQAQHNLDDESPWSKDNYLQGLQDAWEGSDDEEGLKGIWAAAETGDDTLNPDRVAEARRVFDELKRHEAELSEIIDQERDDARRYYEGEALERLQELVAERFCKDAADAAWVIEFRLARVFYATRDFHQRGIRYFDKYEDLINADDKVKAQLIKAFAGITVEPLEGKASRPAPSSSALSESPADQAGSGSSGHQTTAA